MTDGETHHKGLELSLNYDYAEVVDLALVATYAEHKYHGDEMYSAVSIDGNYVGSAPKIFGSARLGWEYSDHGRIELEWLNQGSYYTDPENKRSYEGHDLINLRSSLVITGNWSVQAQLTSVTNAKYAERADYTDFSGDRYFPGEPRALRLSIEGQW
ncbi:TonB-dependent receptor domain-containing protein [Microbulbifer sp. ZKSA006]|uniref:TonB-dependent receptor domain-containing protein n=1 Tax=Microbulbifer sp. ZKSA006 TaxID=3243390 RepID=UPI00403A48D1